MDSPQQAALPTRSHPNVEDAARAQEFRGSHRRWNRFYCKELCKKRNRDFIAEISVPRSTISPAINPQSSQAAHWTNYAGISVNAK
jgi:hypothetical protein